MFFTLTKINERLFANPQSVYCISVGPNDFQFTALSVTK